MVAAAASIVALVVGYFGLRRPAPSEAQPPPHSATPLAAAPPSAPAPEPPPITATSPSHSAAAQTPADTSALDEPRLMAKLRELRSSDPNLTLQLARQGTQRFKNSPDAAERAWFVVKALSDLGRHDEARLEGRALLDEYHDTPWAEDVYRHLFVNPPTHPFERGYGKQLESDP
jgi:hypothetical protein